MCSNLGYPIYCPVLAYGFPFPFIVDSQGVSPVGSVARDPLSLLIGEDDVLLVPTGNFNRFWLLIVDIIGMKWRRQRRQRTTR